MSWFRKKRTPRVDPAELAAQAEAALEQLRAQQPRVNAITVYLERRKHVNGFGTDFEWTLTPKEGR